MIVVAAGEGFTMESSDIISIYQSTLHPIEFTCVFDKKDNQIKVQFEQVGY